MSDSKIKVVKARGPAEFESTVNFLLADGNWRVAETEMSVCDSHYWAMLVQSEKKTDACLISAAPDLLAALERAYLDASTFLNEGDFKRKVEWNAGYIVDAIAKAKGTEPGPYPKKDCQSCGCTFHDPAVLQCEKCKRDRCPSCSEDYHDRQCVEGE